MITIQLKYLTPGGRAFQGGTFPLKRRTPEQVAFEWIKQIQKEVFFEELLEVIVDGKEDITEKVIEIMKAPLD